MAHKLCLSNILLSFIERTDIGWAYLPIFVTQWFAWTWIGICATASNRICIAWWEFATWLLYYFVCWIWICIKRYFEITIEKRGIDCGWDTIVTRHWRAYGLPWGGFRNSLWIVYVCEPSASYIWALSWHLANDIFLICRRVNECSGTGNSSSLGVSSRGPPIFDVGSLNG